MGRGEGYIICSHVLFMHFKSLLLDLENLEARKSAIYEKISMNASEDSPSGSASGSKLSYSAMQQRLKVSLLKAFVPYSYRSSLLCCCTIMCYRNNDYCKNCGIYSIR